GHQVNDAVILVRLGHGFPPWNWATVFYRDICMDRNGGPKRMPAVVEDGRGQCRHLFPWSAISQGGGVPSYVPHRHKSCTTRCNSVRFDLCLGGGPRSRRGVEVKLRGRGEWPQPQTCAPRLSRN